VDKVDFLNTRWAPGMQALYMGEVYKISAVDFSDKAIEIHINGEYQWVAYEDFDLVNIGE